MELLFVVSQDIQFLLFIVTEKTWRAISGLSPSSGTPQKQLLRKVHHDEQNCVGSLLINSRCFKLIVSFTGYPVHRSHYLKEKMNMKRMSGWSKPVNEVPGTMSSASLIISKSKGKRKWPKNMTSHYVKEVKTNNSWRNSNSSKKGRSLLISTETTLSKESTNTMHSIVTSFQEVAADFFLVNCKCWTAVTLPVTFFISTLSGADEKAVTKVCCDGKWTTEMSEASTSVTQSHVGLTCKRRSPQTIKLPMICCSNND